MAPQKSPRSKVQIAGYGALGIGVILLALGIGWRQLLPGRLIWSEQDAKEYTESYEAAHAASVGHPHDHAHGHGSSNDGNRDDHLELAHDRFAQSAHALRNARRIRENWGKGLSLTGAALVLLGALMLRRNS